jgi:hypothetical protein
MFSVLHTSKPSGTVGSIKIDTICASSASSICKLTNATEASNPTKTKPVTEQLHSYIPKQWYSPRYQNHASWLHFYIFTSSTKGALVLMAKKFPK